MKPLSSPKTISGQHRMTSSISATNLHQDSSRVSISQAKGIRSSEIAESKALTTYNRNRMSTSPRAQPLQALRDLSNLVGESLLCTNLESAGGTPSDVSLANAFNDLGSSRKAIDEINALRKELEQKNHMIDKLMKENLNLRKEMEEFLTTVDEAREYIDIELKECNNRIHELEAEIQEVRAENQIYKQQLNKQALELSKGTSSLDDEVGNYYGQAKKEMEDFHFRLNEQIINFMETSKKQYQDFNKMIQVKIEQPKNEKVMMTCPSSPKRENTTPASSTNKTNGAKISRNRNSSMSISCKNPKSPAKGLKGPVTPKTPKTPKSLGLDIRNKTPKSTDLSNNRSIDFRNGSQTSASRLRGGGGSASVQQLETDIENSGMILSGIDLNGQRNPTSHALSPKSSLLRAKLKSDMILQEMRRKLGEGFGQL